MPFVVLWFSVQLSLLRRCFFHCRLLLAVDPEFSDLVEPMLDQARVAEIYSNREVRHLRRFAQPRRLVVRLPRLRYQSNRRTRRQSVKDVSVVRDPRIVHSLFLHPSSRQLPHRVYKP